MNNSSYPFRIIVKNVIFLRLTVESKNTVCKIKKATDWLPFKIIIWIELTEAGKQENRKYNR